MNYADVSGLSDKDLVKKSKELRTQMFEARMKNALGQLANPMTIRELRRDNARLMTAKSAKAAGTTAKAKAPAKKVAAKGKKK